jgi:hypothetical protein
VATFMPGCETNEIPTGVRALRSDGVCLRAKCVTPALALLQCNVDTRSTCAMSYSLFGYQCALLGCPQIEYALEICSVALVTYAR